jgi:hypothetical protein
MPAHWVPEHRHAHLEAKNFFEPDEMRRRRHEKQLKIRKQKRKESLAKLRGLNLNGKPAPISTQVHRSMHHKKVPNELRYELVQRKIRNNFFHPSDATHIGSCLNIINSPVFVPLLKLPPEIRLSIWEYALQGDEGEYQITEAAGIPEPPLLETCKTIRDEAISMFHSLNALDILVRSYSPDLPMLAARKIVALSDQYDITIKPGHLLKTGRPKWANLVRWLRQYHKPEYTCVGFFWDPSYGERFDPDFSRSYKEKMFVVGLFEMMLDMRYTDWEDVENILVLMRSALTMFDWRWEID